MANVEAITKNNASYIMGNFINIDTVREKAGQLDVIVNEKIEKWISTLEGQINEGGLDPYALNIGGDPILNFNAIVLVNDLKEIKTTIKNSKTQIINIAKKHRNAELRKLEDILLQKKREKEDKIISLRQQAIEAEEELRERPGWDINFFVGSYQSQINECQDAIDKIDEQLIKIRADECYSYTGGV